MRASIHFLFGIAVMVLGCGPDPSSHDIELVDHDIVSRAPFGWSGGGGGGSCSPGSKQYGDSCASSTECASQLCIQDASGTYCSTQCSSQGTAPECPSASCIVTAQPGLLVCGRPGTSTAPPPGGSEPPPSGGGAPPPPGSGATPDPDLQAPKVAITSPQPEAQVGNIILLRANITDDKGVTGVEVFLDNKPLTSKNAAPWDFPVTLPGGKHTLRVEAKDATGKKGSAAVTVNVQVQGGSPGTNPPSGGKSFGTACGSASECQSGICANDLTLGTQYCTQTCDGTPGSCPTAAACFSTLNGMQVCAPTSQGQTSQGSPRPTEGGLGCAVGGGEQPDLLLLLLLLAGLVSTRRRR